jgi:SAM-dependent methyltransferase
LVSRSRDLASSFSFAGVAEAYRYRPAYPAELFSILDGLIADRPRLVLDIGAGDGALARPLTELVDRVDAVEKFPAMVEAGRSRPGGGRGNLVWYVEAAEALDLPGPYALVTAGASLHWMDWENVLGRVGRVMAPHAVLAIVDQRYFELPWQAALNEVIIRHSRSPDYDPAFSLPDELERLSLFSIRGRSQTSPVTFRQPTSDYIEQFHSTASLARELMTPAEAERFDEEVRAVLRPYQNADGELILRTIATAVWGRPRTAPESPLAL